MKYLLTGLLICILTAPASACNVCGCSSVQQIPGLFPESRQHFIGLEYQYRSFSSLHTEVNSPEPPGTARQEYQTFLLWGRYHPVKRVRLLGYLPYHINAYQHEGAAQTIRGAGDMTLLAQYQLLKPSDSGVWTQSLYAGGGLKLPTGRHDAGAFQEEDGLPNMQPGTGSLDFSFSADYTLRKGRIGASADAVYTRTTSGPGDYKYGNRLTGAIGVFYLWQKNELSLSPQVRIQYERTGMDYEQYQLRLTHEGTGGYQCFASLGAQLQYRRLGLMMAVYQPLYQQYAGGQVQARFKTEGGFFFFL